MLSTLILMQLDSLGKQTIPLRPIRQRIDRTINVKQGGMGVEIRRHLSFV
jgi:hypothetical protein